MIRTPRIRSTGGALAALSLAASACADTGANSAASASAAAASSVSITLDQERCFGRTAPLLDGPYTASPTRPQPRIATPEPAINGTREEPRFALFNRTGESIAELYWMPSGAADWGANRIGEGASLSPQQFCTARVEKPADASSAACLFDMRAVTTGGRVVESTGFDVCNASRVIFE